MKILRLTFSGVRSYPGTCTIDFTGKTLIGILGDTGAGKTSVLEAITAALYGKCSWTDRVAQLRSDDCSTMMVELEFAVEDRTWTVHRVFHDTRPTQARLTGPDGRHTDGVRPVDDSVRRLVGIDYVTFKSSVLVPQGRFDELLNAGDADRTRILKSLFGIDELQRVRQLAITSQDRVKDLIGQARTQDARLHEDPRATAQTARDHHETAAAGADDLGRRLTALRRLQTRATQATEHARRSTAAAAALDERRVTDHDHITATVHRAQDELQGLQEANTAAEKTATDELADVTGQQERADAAGLGTGTLAAAAQVLREAPSRIAALDHETQAHTQLLTELADEETSLARRADELQDSERHIADLNSRTQDALKEADTAARALDRLTAAVGHTDRSALDLDQRRSELALSRDKLADLAQAPPDSPEAARRAHTQAQQALDDIRRQEAAHTAGDGLDSGDDCPVCTRPLPAGYRPPHPQDAAALTEGVAVLETAAADAAAAEREHIRHTHAVEQLQLAVHEGERLVREAEARLGETLPAVGAQARELAACTAHPRPAAYAKELEGALAAAVAGPTGTEREEPGGLLLRDARGRVAQLQEAADDTGQELARTRAALNVERASLEEATRALAKARTQALRTTERLADERDGLLTSLAALPAPVQAHLPGPPVLPTVDHLQAGAGAVQEEQDRLARLARQQQQLHTRVLSLLAERSELAGRREREVVAPLHQLEARLQRWADSAATVAGLVQEEQRPVLPSAVEADDAAAAQQCAAALAAADTVLMALLEEHSTVARAATQELVEQLSAHAAQVAAAHPGSPALLLPGESDPLDSTLLDGLSGRAGTLRGEAARARQDEQEALSQIPHKEQLVEALAAGERQLAAWQAVSTHLTDGKFLGHLTDLRTRALLAHGSELLQQLSGGRLGFAADFDVVSLASNIPRSSRTLSGGETFQASLALSLALMEMHGRSGIRLESLFLDEGFGTLDTVSLESALQVLRDHVGGDKLLAVISHLRPVAETVHDVLWVEKDHRGSTARWLTPAERDVLVREDLHNLADMA
ncbi:SMC family ATPase [Streptomyces sp. NPDC051453]|uniref:SMC family ATPase n=1 Tax=Streptomyces sp. NPDC051453 TaxID=3154941 RepID=UPI00343D81C5